jgi:hypothetical protein
VNCGNAFSNTCKGIDTKATIDSVAKASAAVSRPEELVQNNPPAITTTGAMLLEKEAKVVNSSSKLGSITRM